MFAAALETSGPEYVLTDVYPPSASGARAQVPPEQCSVVVFNPVPEQLECSSSS